MGNSGRAPKPKTPKREVAPSHWRMPCANVECSLHQLSPYIGKIKSSIAGELVERYSRRGDLLVDPFAGAGTIPLEATLRGRRAFASDISPYARILSRAKLFPPASLELALETAAVALETAEQMPAPDLRCVPQWVRRFFHPQTLRTILNFATVVREAKNDFLMACFLGILHHQRPGFLSFPSSHLVPYLRDKKFPRNDFPHMYGERELRPRLCAKIRRTFKRFQPKTATEASFLETCVENVELPLQFDALITSPPYMNALDYGRDNRLRLWFIDPALTDSVDNGVTQRRIAFSEAIESLARKMELGLKTKGYGVFVVGEVISRSFEAHPAQTVISVLEKEAPSVRLESLISDDIPDVRRTRRECKGVKTEHFLIFRKK